jgi:Chaperone of endosialidase
MKTITKIVHASLTVLGLGFLVLCPMTQAVVPAPDGGYPGFNTAEGQDALLSVNVNTGTFNTAVGWWSLKSDVAGGFNTAIGAGTLAANTGGGNTAIGGAALFSNTTGAGNTAVGVTALFHNIGGYANVATGDRALFSNTEGIGNTATGNYALLNNTTGSNNMACGIAAMSNNNIGNFNTANGVQALFSNTAGSNNTAVGTSALLNNTTGNNNIALGVGAGSNIHTASDTICIGAPGVDITDGCYMGHVFEEALDPDHLSMAIDVNGKVGTPASSRRFKDDIKPMDKASEAILALKPVTFHYKNDKRHRPQFGLIAEEVAQVDPNLVALDKEGKPYSVRYDQVNAMLLNEFLKEHKKVETQQTRIENQEETIARLKAGSEEQQATIASLKSIVEKQEKNMKLFAAHMREQDFKIKGVSVQIEMGRPAPKVVLNEP